MTFDEMTVYKMTVDKMTNSQWKKLAFEQARL